MFAPGLFATVQEFFLRKAQRLLHTGSVEGTLYIDGLPAPAGTPVACTFVRFGKENSFWSCRKTASTRDDGRYRFRFVPAGEVGVGRNYPTINGTPTSIERRVEVRAGEATAVELGRGMGRVAGRFRMPKPFSDYIAWADLPPIWLVCVAPAPDAPSDRVREYSGPWRWADHAGDGWEKDYERWYFVSIDSRGEFEISGVLPGVYSLRFTLPSEFGCIAELLSPASIGFHLLTIPHASEVASPVRLGEVDLPEQGLSLMGDARVEGQLLVDGKPASRGTEVACVVDVNWRDEYADEKMGTCGYLLGSCQETRTDEAGRFVFDGLQLGDATIGRPKSVDAREDEVADCCVGEHDGEFIGEVARLRLERDRAYSVVIGSC